MTVPQPGHSLACATYSVTIGAGGGRDVGDLVTALRQHRRPGQARAAPAARRRRANSNLSSGSSTRFIVVPGSPGCLPGRRFPRSRSDRSAPFFLYGLSDDGGRDDVDESLRA